jgi:hypothetical protein
MYSISRQKGRRVGRVREKERKRPKGTERQIQYKQTEWEKGVGRV